ncbi:nacht domain protein [Colletotrichum chrysophilum]|uniref:Nacht domain protein n=1 Tax=Colletotrichum chrysophilum TaxID=1836956 RepID=A0AAD9AAY3_9PEZI|nr:nacht domain protein [Colletotrichum chrysophilum]
MSLSLPSSSSNQALSRRPPNRGDRADPATGLEIALSQFGAVLTDDERKRLQAQKSGFDDANAAFKFTLELDELDPVRRGRVVATKLCSLLQTVQSFGQVVDTYVSSHPEIAALIWGTVKFTFIVLINFTTYFQRFTDLLSGFDHLIPQFTAYEKLFPNSDRLRKSVCNFHLAIVTCCTEIVNLTRLPWHGKAWAALTASFESKIRPSVDNIRSAANRAKDEFELAKAQNDQLIHVERQKNETTLLKRVWKSSKDIQRVKEDSEVQAKLHKWQSLLKKLSVFDYESAYRNARSKRHKGTAEWVFSTQQFHHWYQNDSTAVLNVAGKIGSGKTVLTANIIDHIMRKKTDKQTISFFFVRFDDINSQSPETIIRCLVHQALARAVVEDSLLELMEKSDALMFDYRSLLDLVSHQILLLDDSFFVVDGFDECTTASQHSILDFLSSLGKQCLRGRMKIVISARDSVTKLIIGSLPAVSRVIVGSDETNRDLDLFARAILTGKQKRGDWSVGDPSLIDEILHSISLGGEGMSLWVYLTIEDISTRRSDEDIRQALLDIPRNLPDTFDRVLQRIQSKGNTEVVCSVFRWTAAACYPLALKQLSEVLNTKINQSSSQESRHVNGISHLPACCENLIQVEDGSETVHFSHHSIRSYLLGPLKKAIPDFNLNLQDCEDFIGDICLTYLNFSDFQTALAKSREQKMDAGHVPVGVVDQTLNALGAKSHGSRIARFVKLPFGKTQPTILSKPLPLSDVNVSAESADANHFPFLQYAKDNWSRHTVRISPSSKAWCLWQKMDVTASYAPWTNTQWQTPGIAPLASEDAHDNVGTAPMRDLSCDDWSKVLFVAQGNRVLRSVGPPAAPGKGCLKIHRV